MKVVIAGGTGFVGSHLQLALLEKDYKVTVLARHQPQQPINFCSIDLSKEIPPAEILAGAEAVINLAGESIFGFPSKSWREKIYNSRVLTVKNLIAAIARLPKKPSVFICASAVGYYGDKREIELTESSPAGDDFLAKLCLDWEKSALQAAKLGIRTVVIRAATVLGDGGLLKILSPIYRLGFGGYLANGSQWFPWIDIKDLINVYILALENKKMGGAINAVAPGVVRYKQFSKNLAAVLEKPAYLSVPRWLIKLTLADLADSILVSQKVVPLKLLTAGYQFAYPDLRPALEDIFRTDC